MLKFRILCAPRDNRKKLQTFGYTKDTTAENYLTSLKIWKFFLKKKQKQEVVNISGPGGDDGQNDPHLFLSNTRWVYRNQLKRFWVTCQKKITRHNLVASSERSSIWVHIEVAIGYRDTCSCSSINSYHFFKFYITLQDF